ncbi:DEAD/DEAH box helicase domain-containing protein [Gordonia polyisoprenivorans VH2]|uniref:DEAD/DEAH box helicase domain-containing protein n=1 Tax=Gordonia polyisoprenivorans (strain DSM 44266 / VH2) TaxID=1112204 RepID=H6N492_GORPV|nr:DEAD/DEAH box helicase [Gordonia polyisoprenivorans]AFA71239.1 DEAD/DEAH box helicase domain-containing protein [Gordonia polyisoprenivorans VH2]
MTREVFNSFSNGVGVHGDLYRELHRAFGDCKSRLWIVVPWWDTSDCAEALLNAAISAAKRNVIVRVIARPDRSNDAVLARLRDAHIEVVTIMNVHMKYVVFDDSVIVHSSNFTRKELSENENVGERSSDVETVTSFDRTFDQLVGDRDALSVGVEKWTPVKSLIPPELTRYLRRYEALNPLQSKAIPAVLSTTGHAMVVAPTSSGKTLIGEVAALRSIVQEGRPAVWLLPARALAAEVARTAALWKSLGIITLQLTGEVNLSSERARRAQLWIATTEKFESMYRRSTLTEFVDRIGCLIIDEVHLVGDEARGATLESVIARLRLAESRTRIVALSATVSNADELATWFNATLIRSSWRPTVLTTQLVSYEPRSGRTQWQQEESGKDAALASLLTELAATDPDRPPKLADAVSGGDLGSVLVFCGSKNGVRRTAAMLAGLEAGTRDDAELVDRSRERGVGIHFRDAPKAGDALRAFNNREIGVLVATSGLSTGVNTPARIVIIRDLSLGVSDLQVSQAQQMLGRAGRAGQEPEGFGFLLVPSDQAARWRRALWDGYKVESQLEGRIDDTLLAEILLGSVTSRNDAEIWFKGTFAYAQSSTLHDVGSVINDLAKHRLIADQDGRLAVSELGKVTARLMVGVEAACAILDELPSIGYPTDATDAENRVLGLVARSVPELRDLAVNARAYEDWVTGTLAACGEGLHLHGGDMPGSRLVAAAAACALRQRDMLSVPRGAKQMSRADLLRAVESFPRYLAWLNALGALGESLWAPAVAGDLARRLQWWVLDPPPERGAGRLLGFIDQLLDPETRAKTLPDVWQRARGAGYTHPNAINAMPRNVDATNEVLAEVIAGRAHLSVEPPDGASLTIDASPYNSLLFVLTNCGGPHAESRTRALGQRIDLPVPGGVRRGELAADIVSYTRADFAYRNLTIDFPEGDQGSGEQAINEARRRVDQLQPSLAVAPHGSRVRRMFMGERKKTLAELMPQVAPSDGFTEIAELLAGTAVDVESRVLNIRAGVEQILIQSSPGGAIRSAAAVLKSGTGTAREFECVLLALVSSLGIDVGMATSNDGDLIGLIDVDGRWRAITPVDGNTGHISRPLVPSSLPDNITPIFSPTPSGPVAPLIPWLAEFAPGSGESAPQQSAAIAPAWTVGLEQLEQSAIENLTYSVLTESPEESAQEEDEDERWAEEDVR